MRIIAAITRNHAPSVRKAQNTRLNPTVISNFQKHDEATRYSSWKGLATIEIWIGQDHLIQTLRAGDCFGEMAVIDHCHLSESVLATEDCTAIPSQRPTVPSH